MSPSKAIHPVCEKLASLIGEQEAGKLLGVSRFTLYKLRGDRRHPLPFMKLRGKILYDPARLLRWLESTGNMRRAAKA